MGSNRCLTCGALIDESCAVPRAACVPCEAPPPAKVRVSVRGKAVWAILLATVPPAVSRTQREHPGPAFFGYQGLPGDFFRIRAQEGAFEVGGIDPALRRESLNTVVGYSSIDVHGPGSQARPHGSRQGKGVTPLREGRAHEPGRHGFVGVKRRANDPGHQSATSRMPRDGCSHALPFIVSRSMRSAFDMMASVAHSTNSRCRSPRLPPQMA